MRAWDLWQCNHIKTKTYAHSIMITTLLLLCNLFLYNKYRLLNTQTLKQALMLWQADKNIVFNYIFTFLLHKVKFWHHCMFSLRLKIPLFLKYFKLIRSYMVMLLLFPKLINRTILVDVVCNSITYSWWCDSGLVSVFCTGIYSDTYW